MKNLNVATLLLSTLLLYACAPSLGESEQELALEDIASGHGQSRLKQRTDAPTRHGIDYQIQGRHYNADLYLSSAPPRAGIVLVPGVVPAGKDDERLVTLANTLARLRFAVLVPDIKGLRRYRVRGDDVQAVADAFQHLISQPVLSPEGRAGIAGFSYGAGPVLLAALEPEIRHKVRFIVTMGGYHDLRSLVTYFTTGYYRDPQTGRWRYYTPNPYAAWVFAQSNAELLERPEDQAWMKTHISALMKGEEADDTAALPKLAPDARALMALLTNHQPDQVPKLIGELSPSIRAELAAINPAAHDLSDLQAQVILVHGRRDDIIPYTESIALAQALPPEQVQLFLIEGIAHVNLRLQKGDIPLLSAAMKQLLDHRGPP